jgi:hypothetical protein
VSLRVAQFIYRWRRLLTGLIVLGALVLAPRAHIQTIDNDLSAWFSADDPIFKDYVRFRDEFGGTRTVIIAIEAPSRARMFSTRSSVPISNAYRPFSASAVLPPPRSSTRSHHLVLMTMAVCASGG